MIILKRFAFIDALRGFAVFGVLMVHVGQDVTNLPDWVRNITDEGARGVQLFFILSAFTLFLSMEKRAKEDNYASFLLRRFFRIAPLFYLALLFYPAFYHIIAVLQNNPTKEVSIGNIIGTLTFVGNSASPYWINNLVPGGWSITAEFLFYLFVPYLFFKITSLKKALIFTTLIFFVGTAFTLILSRFQSIPEEGLYREYLFYLFPNQMAVFALGIVLAYLIKNNYSFTPKQAKIMVTITTIALLLLTQINAGLLPLHFVFSIGFVIITLALSAHPFKIFVNKFWIFVGKVSFSVYLTHFLVLKVADFALDSLQLNLNWVVWYLVLFSITFAITLVLSNWTYKFIEKPFIKFGNEFINRTKEKQLPKALQ